MSPNILLSQLRLQMSFLRNGALADSDLVARKIWDGVYAN